MTTIRIPRHFRRACLGLAISLALVEPALALNFQLGEIDGQFDSALSIGAGWSTQNPDSRLLHVASVDDGRRNYEAGDAFSKLLKGTHDLELKYADSGVFLRGTYWYDYALADEDQRFKDVEDSGRRTANRSSGAQLLDAFVYHRYDIAEQPGSVRLGKQVVNWGESTFIPGGISVVNPVNISALRRPGSELKEALVPVNMFYLSQSFTENLSSEMFYQLDWQQSDLDNCGTFFSISDYLADGCTGLNVGGDLTGNPLAERALSPFGVTLQQEGILIPRGPDRYARNGGQFGLALRWFVPELDTEFAAYLMNYHSRLPYVGSVASPYLTNTDFAPQVCASLGLSGASCGAALNSSTGKSLAGALRLGTSQYFQEYPEDIRLYGLTFSTTLPTGTALQGEISYRPNLPLQFNGIDIIQASLNDPSRSPLVASGAMVAADSAVNTGYRRKPVTQVQSTATHLFSQVLGAEQLLLVGEAGMTYVGNLEGNGGPRYGRNIAFGGGALNDNALCTGNSATPGNCTNQGFTTRFSWGYRARAVLTYADAFAGIDLKPSLSWSQDVKGYGPIETAGFVEGSKAVSFGLDADYKSTYNASLSYTNYFGGDYNIRTDRDFVALSLGVTF
ncbi:DUF1302 domain-containing protein [Pseudomonas sp. CAN2814]|uniref:DUF1302 domain-containing protein n=1 Tax=Pseudomonas sp. CAN1 TaxID=3046726 RepID=UPI00264A0945|nr:DUF1302 domain-containing protein [Pseudomonas sp. CAN1]MDN6860237.1 DUF1302 domain-containing protein [Pseudomonas sp. CAN1]